MAARTTEPDLDPAIKYRMPTYTLHQQWQQWVVALSVTKSAVNHFLTNADAVSAEARERARAR